MGQTASVQAPSPHSTLSRRVRELWNSLNNRVVLEMHHPLLDDNQKLVLNRQLYALECSLF